MNEFNMTPVFRQGLNEITDGIDIKAPEYCKKNSLCNQRCLKHYRDICNRKEGIYTCPYGFNSYVFTKESDIIVFTSLRIKDKYDKKRVMPKIQNEKKLNREIDEETLNIYRDAYEQFFENEKKYDEYADFVNAIFHDIRKFNSQIKIKNDIISRQAGANNRYDQIRTASQSIQKTCWFLTVRLDAFYLAADQNFLAGDTKTSYNIYKIFDKMHRCMKEQEEKKNLLVDFNTNRSLKNMMAYDSIELLPFILMDNAIKYAPYGTKIEINFYEKEDMQHVQVKSTGPMLKAGEEQRIFERGYRGENAKAQTADGMGIGLFTAKCICDQHNISIAVKSHDITIKTIQNVEFSEFTIDFWITL